MVISFLSPFGFELVAKAATKGNKSQLQIPLILMVPTEGVEPTHPYGYQILSLARLPIPPHRPPVAHYKSLARDVNKFLATGCGNGLRCAVVFLNKD